MIVPILEIVKDYMSRVCEELCMELSAHRASLVLLSLGQLFREGVTPRREMRVGEGKEG